MFLICAKWLLEPSICTKKTILVLYFSSRRSIFQIRGRAKRIMKLSLRVYLLSGLHEGVISSGYPLSLIDLRHLWKEIDKTNLADVIQSLLVSLDFSFKGLVLLDFALNVAQVSVGFFWSNQQTFIQPIVHLRKEKKLTTSRVSTAFKLHLLLLLLLKIDISPFHNTIIECFQDISLHCFLTRNFTLYFISIRQGV